MQFLIFFGEKTYPMQITNLPVSSLDWIFIAEFETLQNKGLYNGNAGHNLDFSDENHAIIFSSLAGENRMGLGKIMVETNIIGRSLDTSWRENFWVANNIR